VESTKKTGDVTVDFPAPCKKREQGTGATFP